jgi:hypothetical protein
LATLTIVIAATQHWFRPYFRSLVSFGMLAALAKKKNSPFCLLPAFFSRPVQTCRARGWLETNATDLLNPICTGFVWFGKYCIPTENLKSLKMPTILACGNRNAAQCPVSKKAICLRAANPRRTLNKICTRVAAFFLLK